MLRFLACASAAARTHATPDTAQVIPNNSVIVIAGRISRFGEDILNAGIVVSGIEPPVSSDSLLHHCFYLRVIRHVAANRKRLVTLIGKLFGCGLHCLLIPVCNNTDAPDSAKAFAVASPNPDAAPVTSATLFRRYVHDDLLTFLSLLSLTWQAVLLVRDFFQPVHRFAV